jgi:hypothetical protein
MISKLSNSLADCRPTGVQISVFQHVWAIHVQQHIIEPTGTIEV